MLTFTDTTVDGRPSFTFAYQGGVVNFDFNVSDPLRVSLQAYEDLANGVLVTKENNYKPTPISFSFSNGHDEAQDIKLSPTDQRDRLKVQFILYRIGHALKVNLPFHSCQAAFQQAAQWRATQK